jgi:hypothetical protein
VGWGGGGLSAFLGALRQMYVTSGILSFTPPLGVQGWWMYPVAKGQVRFHTKRATAP